MISTFSTEMPGFLHKQASDESSCIDFLYISGLPDSKKRQRNYFLCRLYSLFFLYTEFFRILQLSLLHTQGSELHRLCLQHRHRLHLLLPLHLHPVLSVLHLLPEVRYCRLLSLHHRCLRHLTVLLASNDRRIFIGNAPSASAVQSRQFFYTHLCDKFAHRSFSFNDIF